MKRWLCALLAILLLLPSAASLAEPAEVITKGITYQQGGKKIDQKKLKKMLDGDYSTFFTLKPRQSFTATCETEVGAAYLKIFDWIPDLKL